MLRNDTEQYYSDLAAYHKKMRDVPPEKMTDFFTNRIVGYEEHMMLFEDGYRRYAEIFRKKWRALPEEYRGKPITDLGCGTGLELDYLYPDFPTLAVCGIDLNEAMLRRFRERHPDKAIETVCADYFQAELPAAPAVLSFESLHHFPLAQKAALYARIADSLLPSGFFLFGDYMACSVREEEMCAAFAREKRERFHVPPEQFIHVDTPIYYEKELAAVQNAGFRSVEIVHAENGVVILYAEK